MHITYVGTYVFVMYAYCLHYTVYSTALNLRLHIVYMIIQALLQIYVYREISIYILKLLYPFVRAYQPRKITQWRLHCIQIKNIIICIFSLSRHRHRHRHRCRCCLRRDSPRALEQKWHKRYPENAQCTTAIGIWNEAAIYR